MYLAFGKLKLLHLGNFMLLQKVYASPSRRRMDTKGETEDMTYPYICFMIDNFDEVTKNFLKTIYISQLFLFNRMIGVNFKFFRFFLI